MTDLQYILNLKSNIPGFEILFNGESKGIVKASAKTLPLSLNQIQDDFGGRVDIRLQKTNYVSAIRYELAVTRNPAFQTNSNLGLSGEDMDVYSNVPEFVLFVNRYENDELSNYTQDFSAEIIDLEFDLKSSLQKGEGAAGNNIKTNASGLVGIGTDENDANVGDPQGFKVAVNGLLSSAKFIVNKEEEIVIDKNAGVYNFNVGDDVEIVSTDITKFRISEVSARGINVNVSQKAETNLESVKFKNTINIPLSIIITTVEVPPVDREVPTISLLKPDENRKYNVNTKADYPVGIRKNDVVTGLRVVIGNEVITFSELAAEQDFVIIIPQRYLTAIGAYNIQIIPNNLEGDGQPLNFTLNVVNEVWVGVPDIKNIRYPSRIEGPDYVGYDVDFEIGYESVNTDWVKVLRDGGSSFVKAPSTGKITLNVKKLLELDGLAVSENENQVNITLNLIPYNESGISVVTGKTEIVQIAFSKSSLTIPRNIAVNRIAEGFSSQFDEKILETESSKYLTHALHLGDGNNKVITTWTGSNGSLILKLYEPLPTSVQPNQQVWISKYQSNPVIETVTVSGLDGEFCSPLKGPNFSLEPDNGIGFSIYDELIASGSETSNDLINRYVGTLGIDTSKLNIQYTNETEYLFSNFINFSSAEERVNNFFYKMKLVDDYKSKLENLTDGLSEGILLTETTPPQVLLTDGDDLFEFEIEKFVFRNPTEGIEASKILELLNTTLRNFDGFEKFLYSSIEPSDLVYPKFLSNTPFSGFPVYILKRTTDPLVVAWYNSLLSAAREFDKNNPNYVVNNIPEFIYNDNNNADFLLFLDMIGHHFDAIWVHINALSGMKVVDEAGIKGIPDGFVLNMLKSLGWDGKRAFDSQFLWEYAFGQNKDGSQKYSTSLEDANNQVWRRILNNLPYLLKHKGTSRAMKAIMACYGVPQSMLTIMEFGGPQDPTKGGVSQFTFDDRTAALQLQSGSSVLIPWKNVVSTGIKPQSIEFMLKPDTVNDTITILSGSDFNLSINPINQRDIELILNLDGSIETSPSFSLSTEYYSNILINKTDIPLSNSKYDFFLNTSNGEDIILSVSASITASNSIWESGSYISIGNDFSGALDEVRLWRIPLQESKFENHTLFPDAINGNSISSSTEDLMFRLDFEYPKDRILDPYIKNVAITQAYGEGFATASNFYEANEYPYQYIPYERTVTANVPSLGFNYANKIRFEEQELVTELSYKHRATKKAFDRAPIDSNRLGLFLSPIKELNMDIVKAFGNFNIDNYIGNPADEYRSGYKELDTLREYYFDRLNLNVSEYIQLVKYINKSLFDVLADLAPARAKVSKGLLIEPHYLERSKVKWNKPDVENISYVGNIHVEDVESVEMKYNTFEANISEEDETVLKGEFATLLAEINEEEQIELVANTAFYAGEFEYITDDFIEADIPTFRADITYELRYELLSELETFGKYESVGNQANSMDNLGFGLYAEDTTTIWKRYDFNSNYTESRANVFLVESERLKNVLTQVSGYPRVGAAPDEQVEYALVPTPFKEYVVSILPFPDTLTVSGDITNVTPLRGYFPTHYRFKNNLSEGLQRTFFKGSVQNATTTPDGLSPVETFTTNPNILRVANTGRGSGEPILVVD
jgi:hypothetical protein